MNHLQPEKLPLETPNPVLARLEVLREHLPEIFSDGRIDLERLKTLLGDELETSRERFGLSWAGKAEAVRAVQISSTGALRPKRDQSVDFDSTGNAIIEGDNLEVLKLLQRSYHNKIKMIYIDPPYNTGNDNDFVYRDNFRDGLRQYQLWSGQVADDGSKLTTNGDHAGRIHSRWLSMMYPRLQLAKSLLKDDGVIFISIDDHEVHSLRMVMDEIFGEENFLVQFTWEKTRKNDAKLFSVGHEYMLVYAKNLAQIKENKTIWREQKPGAKEILEKYKSLRNTFGNNDEDVQKGLRDWYTTLPSSHPSKKLSRYKWIDKNGPWRDRDISWPGGGGPRYDVIHPKTKKPCKVPERGWIFTTLEGMQAQIKMGLVVFREDHTEPPFRKAHLIPVPEELDEETEFDEDSEIENGEEVTVVGLQVMPSVIYKQSQVAVKYLRQLLDGKIFDNPKDHEILARLFRYCGGEETDFTVLDFFAGAGSTAEAVFSLNQEDKGNRKFILVQLPEKTPKKSNAIKAGYETVSQITRERVKRAAAKIRESMNGSLNLESPPDLGFRAFTLDSSNFKIWDNENPDLEGQLLALVQNVIDGRTEEDILFELLLKSGLPLSSGITTLTVAEKRVYSVSEGTLLICLERPITSDTLRGVMALKPAQVLCLDVAFEGDDALKTNMVLEMRDHEILFRTV